MTEQDSEWATGAFGVAITILMIGVGLGSAFLLANAAVDIAIVAIGTKYLP